MYFVYFSKYIITLILLHIYILFILFILIFYILYDSCRDMTEALLPLRCIYDFGRIGLKYGHIVIPTCHNNWGPMYFCKIVKVQ